MKKIISAVMAVTMIGTTFVSVDASRKREAENSVSEETAASNKLEAVTIDPATHVYTENLPGKKKTNNAYSGYTYNGVEIDVPDFSRFQEFEADEVKNMSDAIVDYMGWDLLLGTSDWQDNENCFNFKPISGLSSTTNQVFGYGRKKFGYEEIKLKAKVRNDSGSLDGNWLGLSFMCTSTQSLQWTGNPGYLIVVKPTSIELQKWFNSCVMLEVKDVSLLKHNEWQEYTIKTEKLEEGARIQFYIDGEEVFNFEDSTGPFGPDEGYFNITDSGFSEVYIAPIDNAATISQSGISSRPTSSDSTQNTGDVTISGNVMTFGGQEKNIAETYIENGYFMLPLRSVSEVLGGFVEWDKVTRTASVSTGGKVMKATDTYDEYSIGDKYFKVGCSSRIINGTLYVPADAIAKLFGKKLSVEGNKLYLTD